VAFVDPSCVGCGLCGEVAHAAALCPAFYQAERLRNAGPLERLLHAVRSRAIGLLGGGRAA
jgi:indolepyruvate ferredoxin oxidoreductase alpha subunit